MSDQIFEEEISLDDLRENQANDHLEEFLCDEIEHFRETSILSKQQLLDSIHETRSRYKADSESENAKYDLAFYGILDDLLQEFSRKIQYSLVLPEPLHDWWCYSYSITVYGIKLNLCYIDWCGTSTGFAFNDYQKFTLLNIPAKMLSVEEYAKKYGVESVTVRQWIRRAKLRSARKVASEWRIPELTSVRLERNYESFVYSWPSKLPDLPEKFAFLNEFRGILLEKGERGAGYLATPYIEYDHTFSTLYDDATETIEARAKKLSKYPSLKINSDGIISLTSKEREQLEVFLLANPFVQRGNDSSDSYMRIDIIAGDYNGFGSIDFDEWPYDD